MSNYTVQTNFGAKDDLPSGNAAKVIRGADFTVEFDNIATAIGTKVDKSNAITLGLANSGSFTQAGNVSITGTTTFNGEVDVSGDVAVDTDTLFVDVSEDRVGINNASPATALDVTGVITTDGLTTSAAINVPDDTKINFGDNNELQIYHDSSGVSGSSTFFSNHIRTSSPANFLYLESDIIALNTLSGLGMISAVNGLVNLAGRLQTNSYGVDITGTDGASVIAKVEADDAESANLKLKNTEGEFDIRCDGGTLDIYDVTDGASRLSFNTSGVATFGGNQVKSDVFSGITNTNSLLVLGNDAVTFNETNGTTILANENLNLLAGVNDKIRLGEVNNSTKMAVLDTSNGNFGINTDSPTEKLDVNSDSIRLRTAKTPASASATGTQGQIAWDANYMYVCTATNTWKRVALATWS